MKSKFIAVVLSGITLVLAGSASAQVVKPGLWQLYTTTPGKTAEVNPMEGYVARMRKEMETMEPELRREMEEMLAQLAAKESAFTAEGFRTKECVTKEDVAKIGNLVVKDSGSCQTTVSPVENGQMKVNGRCTQPPSTSSALIRFQGNKAFSFESTLSMKDAHGQPLEYKYTGSGKWLGSDCGAVKPGSAGE